MLDPVEFGDAMAAIVREAQTPLLKRIEQLEARQPEKGERGLQGDAGKDAAPIEVSAVAAEVMTDDQMRTLVNAHIAESVQRYFEANPIKHGKDGERGKDAEPVEASTVVAELLSGDEVKTLVDLHVAEAVQKFFEMHPVQNGKDGAPGEKGDKGDSIKGDPGADGIGLAGAFVNRDGHLVVTTTKGDPINLGPVVGKDGERGRDGLDFEGAELDYDGERGLILRSNTGVERIKRLPIPMNKGFWRESMACEKADIVTHNGTAWIALKDTTAKPCIENAEDWQLFARKGRDGVDGKNGRDLGHAPPVKLSGHGGGGTSDVTGSGGGNG